MNGEVQVRYFQKERETREWEARSTGLERRFMDIFKHAFLKSKAYRDLYGTHGIDPSDISGLGDLEKLPILRLDDLVRRQEQEAPFGGFETVDPGKIRRIYINPGLIWQPGEWDYRDTSWAEALCAAGFKPGDRIINTFNYHLWPFAFMLDESVKMINATVVPTGVGNTLMQVKIMHRLRISGFLGTPSFLMTLAQRAESMGLNPGEDLNLERALVGAEMLPESLRSRIEDRLKMTVRQGYGTVLLGCLGYECQFMNGLHVPDNILVEVIDPQSEKPVKWGAAGEVVATNFNSDYPMIRMATGDLSMFSHETCPCGRTSPILKRILGRIDQASKVRGTFIHPWQTDEVVSRFPEVFKYQVVITRQDHRDVMTFVVELKEDTVEAERLKGRMERDIKDLLTVKGGVKFVPKGTLPDLHKKIEDRRSWE
jgi:phenylacetate-CoA ligase